MANISTLTVSLVADTAKFSNGLKKASKQSSAFAKGLTKTFKVAGLAVAALTVGLAGLIATSLKLVDTQRKTARTLGTTQKIFAGLSLAAGISGISVESFTKALKRQQKSIVDASDGLQTQARAFQRLNLDTKKLIELPVEKQFAAITTALGTVENATLRTAIASDIFGAKNADLINVLELGEKGLANFIDKAQELGVALEDDQTAAIEEANDALLVMKTAFQGLGNQLAARFSPLITAAAEAITNIVSRVTAAIPAFTAWAASILGVERALEGLTLADIQAEILQIDKDILDVTGTVRGFEEILSRNPLDLGSAAGLEVFQKQLDELIIRYNKAIAKSVELKKAAGIPIGGAGGAGGTDLSNDATITAATGTLQEIAINPQLRETADLMAKNLEATKAFVADFLRTFDNTRTPVEQFNARIEEIRNNPFIDGELQQRAIDDAVERLHAGLEQIKETTDEVSTAAVEFWRSAFEQMQNDLADFLFDPFEDGLKGMIKGFADTLRKMVANLLASKLLELFFGQFGAIFGISGTPTVPSRAIGGPTGGRTPHLVGENGPELFTPGASGAIRPVGAINFQSTTNIGGGGGGLDIATLIPILEQNNRKVKGELLDEIDRGANA